MSCFSSSYFFVGGILLVQGEEIGLPLEVVTAFFGGVEADGFEGFDGVA